MEGEQNTNQGAAPQGAPENAGTAPAGGTSNESAKPAHDERLMAALSYISVLVVIPYLIAKDNPFVKFHIKQGVVLVIGELLAYALMIVMPMLFPIAGLIHLAAFILSILGILNVLQRKESELPVVGKYASHVNI